MNGGIIICPPAEIPNTGDYSAWREVKDIHGTAIPRTLTTQEQLLKTLEIIVDELSHCAAIVGDPMYASVKADYRLKLREKISDAREVMAKAKEGAA